MTICQQLLDENRGNTWISQVDRCLTTFSFKRQFEAHKKMPSTSCQIWGNHWHMYDCWSIFYVWNSEADNWWQPKQTPKKNGEARAGRKIMPANTCKRNNMSTNMSTTLGWEFWKNGFPELTGFWLYFSFKRQFEAHKRFPSMSC